MPKQHCFSFLLQQVHPVFTGCCQYAYTHEAMRLLPKGASAHSWWRRLQTAKQQESCVVSGRLQHVLCTHAAPVLHYQHVLTAGQEPAAGLDSSRLTDCTTCRIHNELRVLTALLRSKHLSCRTQV
jgi:hypothetical protein